jgi:pimeloyl-ACP methyl ester carboxylesterase
MIIRGITAMKFNTVGDEKNPVMVILAGSFCPSTCMSYLYDSWKKDFYIIAPEYNGYDENSTFTTRKQEAKEIVLYLKKQGITKIKMVYGQSMGAEIAIELIHQMLGAGISVDKGFFDGAPCIRLSKAYKAFMYFKFRTMIRMLRDKNIDDVMNMKLVKQFTNGDTESLRPMMEPMIAVAPYLTDENIKNQTECCYTFDFPVFDERFQKNLYFFYAREEKAYRTCIKGVKKAYPYARYKVVSGFGHLTYSVRETEKYTEIIRRICGSV